jgi:hypothetical protein
MKVVNELFENMKGFQRIGNTVTDKISILALISGILLNFSIQRFWSSWFLPKTVQAETYELNVKIHVKLSLCFIRHYTYLEDVWEAGVEVQIHLFLTSTPDRGEW